MRRPVTEVGADRQGEGSGIVRDQALESCEPVGARRPWHLRRGIARLAQAVKRMSEAVHALRLSVDHSRLHPYCLGIFAAVAILFQRATSDFTSAPSASGVLAPGS